jgi:hypothetical protein
MNFPYRHVLFCLFASIFLVLPSSVFAELVDHIVAAVNNEVITASELAQAVAMNELLGNTGGQDRTALQTETLNGLITRRLLVQEARRLRFVELSDQEINAQIGSFKKRFASDAAFAAFLKTQDMTERELARMLGERLLVEGFVEKKVGLFVRVSRDEAQSYFDAHPAQFKGKRFQDVQNSITAVLTDRKVGQQLEQYVSELRARAEIRINPPEPLSSPVSPAVE